MKVNSSRSKFLTDSFSHSSGLYLTPDYGRYGLQRASFFSLVPIMSRVLQFLIERGNRQTSSALMCSVCKCILLDCIALSCPPQFCSLLFCTVLNSLSNFICILFSFIIISTFLCLNFFFTFNPQSRKKNPTFSLWYYRPYCFRYIQA